MKILIINQHPQDVIGGSEIQCDLIATYLHRFGHEVLYGAINSRRHNYEVDYKLVPLGNPFVVSYSKLVRDFHPDIIYWRFNKIHLFAAALISKFYRAKFVFAVSAFSDTERWIWTGREVLPRRSMSPRNGWILKKIMNAAFLLKWPIISAWNYNGFYFADASVTVNSEFLGKLPIRFQTAVHNSTQTECEHFRWDKPYVVWVANIKAKKNPDKFIELAEHYVEGGVDFLMIGSIQDGRYAYIQGADQLPRNFHYLGPKSPEQVNGILKSSLFLVHTCDPECFSGNFIQAWSQGKPTISLYFDPESIIKNNQLGYVSGSLDQMVKDVKNLIEDSQLRMEIGERAKNFAKQNFDPESNIRKLERFLFEVLNA